MNEEATPTTKQGGKKVRQKEPPAKEIIDSKKSAPSGSEFGAPGHDIRK